MKKKKQRSKLVSSTNLDDIEPKEIKEYNWPQYQLYRRPKAVKVGAINGQGQANLADPEQGPLQNILQFPPVDDPGGLGRDIVDGPIAELQDLGPQHHDETVKFGLVPPT